MLAGCQGLVGAFPHTRHGNRLPGRAVPPPLGTPAYRRTGVGAPTLEGRARLARGTAQGSDRIRRNHGSLTRAANPSVPALPAAGLLAAGPGDMNPPASSLRLGPEFDDFLFAPVGEDRNGLPLSIVSLLGRLDLDPWLEAASLAGQPAEAAVQRLAALLAALPVPSLKQADPGAMAAQLIALLPRRTDPKARSAVPPVNVSAVTFPRVVMTVILFVIFLILLIGRSFGSTRRDPPAHADIVHTPAPLTAPSQTSPRIERNLPKRVAPVYKP